MPMTFQRAWIGTAVASLAIASLFALSLPAQAPASTSGAVVLKPMDYRHYVDTFHQQEREATGKIYEGEGGEDSWTWMRRTIPWFDSSDKSFEEMYYFRWYAWKKHLVRTPAGYIITEWLPKQKT